MKSQRRGVGLLPGAEGLYIRDEVSARIAAPHRDGGKQRDIRQTSRQLPYILRSFRSPSRHSSDSEITSTAISGAIEIALFSRGIRLARSAETHANIRNPHTIGKLVSANALPDRVLSRYSVKISKTVVLINSRKAPALPTTINAITKHHMWVRIVRGAWATTKPN